MSAVLQARTLNLTEATVQATCGARNHTRGHSYMRRDHVLDLQIREQTEDKISLMARTRGSGDQIYTQMIQVRRRAKEAALWGDCSCPVEVNCKHVAAACLAYIERADSNTPPPDATAGLTDWFEKLAHEEPAEEKRSDQPHYLLVPMEAASNGVLQLGMDVHLTRQRANGDSYTKGRLIVGSEVTQHQFSNTELSDDDERILSLLVRLYRDTWSSHVPLAGPLGYSVIRWAVGTGRCHLESLENGPLSWAGERTVNWQWRKRTHGWLQLQPELEPSANLIATDPGLYLDPQNRQLGIAADATPMSDRQRQLLASAPQVPEPQAAALTHKLMKRGLKLPVPLPSGEASRKLSGLKPRPCLQLLQVGDGPEGHHELRLSFDYGGHELPALETPEASSLVLDDQQLIEIQRNAQIEEQTQQRLADLGFRRDPSLTGEFRLTPDAPTRAHGAAIWQRFLEDEIEQLEAEDWILNTDESFALEFQTSELDTEFEDRNDWFSLRFDLDIDGQRQPLAPLLAPIINQLMPLPREQWPDPVPIAIDANRYTSVPAETLQPILQMLNELFGEKVESAGERLELKRFEAGALAHLQASRLPEAARRLHELAEKLRDFSGIAAVEPPSSLQAQLREYQRSGLNWLQFLREYGLAGILADDMGLGKTLQTLAHLLIEKEAGRADLPSLVVAPTSVLSNWAREANRFAPDLNVLVLHGPDRHRDFGRLDHYDLVITSYPLLVRDAEALQQQTFHFVVLDEAQTIKNPRAKSAQITRQLNSRHRLCLTGTPMENHLGELWAQFDFLMPGFLGDAAQFKRLFRTPIERHGDTQQRERLARRVRPFMLRRRKQEVATELPPKTEIIRSVELGPSQAQLYESVRISMDQRVREAIARQGLGRSHITVLDALLKLRQVCCDPRLVKLEAARRVEESAKLELLMEMLPELLEEGRKVLVFSQFRQMLSLIEDELQQRNIHYSVLTGQTRDRDAAIERFKRDDCNLFLISLKAGGVGLNLTEADTVILYDPWWNPAAEAQAADRSHRIGQDKPVFVYKLITENSVEDRILAMQQRKQALADGVYQDEADEPLAQLDADSLNALFAPLDD